MEEIMLNNNSENTNKKKNNVIYVTIAIVITMVVFFGIFYWIIFDSSTKSKLDISSTHITTSYNEYLGYSATISGVAKNNTKKNYTYASLEFTIYDVSGNNLGTAYANINNLASGDTWNFNATLLSFPSTKPVSYKLVDIIAW